jgi:2-methylisocitrate lyase-like PEP mutase family enzyme
MIALSRRIRCEESSVPERTSLRPMLPPRDGPYHRSIATGSQTRPWEQFLSLHRPGRPLLMPNAWDVGSAKLLASLGFGALATTSSGHAATLGRLDGSVTREEALEHAASLACATGLPVSADLEDGFGEDPETVAETVRRAADVGLAGCSVEDHSRVADDLYELEHARERVAAAVEAARAERGRIVLSARAENFVCGRPDLNDTIARLQAYQEAGADVLYAPGLRSAEDIGTVVRELERPVNVLVVAGVPPVAELAQLGVSRVSIGGGFAFAALGALVDAATELRDRGTYGFLATARAGSNASNAAFS